MHTLESSGSLRLEGGVALEVKGVSAPLACAR